jgi:hypothetical protein
MATTGHDSVGSSFPDQDHLRRSLPFSTLTWMAAAFRGAVSGVTNVVGESVANPKNVWTQPLSHRRPPGQLLVEAPPALLARLAVEAAENGLSMNEWAIRKLALDVNTVIGRTRHDDARPRNAFPPRC